MATTASSPISPRVPLPETPTRRRASSHPAALFILRRVAGGLVALIIASALIYLAVQVLPGNVVQVVLGRTATPARIAAVEHSLHLKQSVPVRYWDWLRGMFTGHLGDSQAALAQGDRLSVWHAIRAPLANSAILALITILLFIPLSLFLGTLAALRAGRAADTVISTIALALSTLPEFLIGTFLIVIFFTLLNVLPPTSQIPQGQSPLSHINELVLPILTLLSVSCAFGARLLRASVIEALDEDYVAMARLNGFRERRVVWRYALRNALAPSIQVIAQMIQYLLGGIIITESVFNYPGIGSTLVQSVLVRDPQEVSVIAFLLAAIYITVNILADFAVVFLVPRLRTQL